MSHNPLHKSAREVMEEELCVWKATLKQEMKQQNWISALRKARLAFINAKIKHYEDGIKNFDDLNLGGEDSVRRTTEPRKSRSFRPLLLLILAMLMVRPAFAAYDPEVRCIIGEAGNQGYQGMLAVASGIRNRGNLKGVYGCKAKHVDNEPEWVWEMASKAWSESERSRLHSGTHWENIKAFGKPYWVDSMVKVYEYKDHIFYKEAK